jgi:DNA mismatch endonuclease (patch repair protein)
MSRVGSKNTTPELQVRRAAHMRGLRFRLHRKDLPGKPDMVFPKHKLAIFVHGCFWHRHAYCKKATTPKSRQDFWEAKFASNIARDAHAVSELKQLGWRVEVIWECETKSEAAIASRLDAIFGVI